MSFNLEQVEISDITSNGDVLKVITQKDQRNFDFSEIINVEVNEVHQEDNTGAFATIGTIVGLIAGDFTGAISGGFSGAISPIPCALVRVLCQLGSAVVIINNIEKQRCLS